jgi:hypothetical protein
MGSARVSRVGFGVSPKQSFQHTGTTADHEQRERTCSPLIVNLRLITLLPMLTIVRFVGAVSLPCLCCANAYTAATPDPRAPVRIQFARSDLDDILYFYSSLSGKPLHVDAGVGGTVDLMSQGIPRAETLRWIRHQLLERYGIDIRDIPGSNIHVAWSTDHEEARETTRRSLKKTPDARVIDSAELRAKKPH